MQTTQNQWAVKSNGPDPAKLSQQGKGPIQILMAIASYVLHITHAISNIASLPCNALCWPLPSNWSCFRQIISYQRGVSNHRAGQWWEGVMSQQTNYMTLTGVYSSMHPSLSRITTIAWLLVLNKFRCYGTLKLQWNFSIMDTIRLMTTVLTNMVHL